MNTNLLIYILFAHFVADFICQADEDAKNKSHSFSHLSHHIYCYMMSMLAVLVMSYPYFKLKFLPVFYYVALNSTIHLVVDFFTSKGTSYFYKKGNIHSFFIVVGFDQFLHAATLILTMGLLK